MESNLAIQQEAEKFQIASKKDPRIFMTEALDVKLWDKQVEIAISVRDNMFTAVPSCYASGKSFDASCIALWYYYTFIPSKVITTSSSWGQLEKILWAEIRSRFNNAAIPLGGKLLNTDHKNDENWFMTGLSPMINANEEATRMEGYHSPHVLVIVDQAHGVKDELINVCEALMLNDNCRFLMLGNPTSKSGRFYKCCERSDKYNVIKISAFDTPNVISGKDLIPGLVTSTYIENMREEWGEDHPLWKSKVLGEFPDESENVLIMLKWVEDAIDRSIDPTGPKGIGVDVARFGEDETVIITMHGDKVIDVENMKGKRTYEIAGRVMNKMNRFDVSAKAVCVDDTGIGGGVTDDLHREGFNITPVNNGGVPEDKEHFQDKVTEMGWEVRKCFEKGNIDIPANAKLEAQLPITRYFQQKNGKLKLESKDDMRKRGEKSPDYRDALFLAKEGQKYYDGGEGGPRMTLL